VKPEPGCDKQTDQGETQYDRRCEYSESEMNEQIFGLTGGNNIRTDKF